jgi:hypothetical protein
VHYNTKKPRNAGLFNVNRFDSIQHGHMRHPELRSGELLVKPFGLFVGDAKNIMRRGNYLRHIVSTAMVAVNTVSSSFYYSPKA